MTRTERTSRFHFHIYITCLALSLLCSSSVMASRLHNGVCDVTSSFIPRNQGRDRARQWVGLIDHLYFTNESGCNYGTFSWIAEYTRSFRPQRIADCLFGLDLIRSNTSVPNNSSSCNFDCNNNCDQRCILIQGSAVANRDANAWLADNFYLPTNFNGSFCVEPRIQNFLFEFDYYLGLDAWLCGLYFRIWGPLTWTKWDLNFCENCNTGTIGYSEGYFGPNEILGSSLLNNFGEYAAGCAPNDIPEDGLVFNGLRYAKMLPCSEKRFGFANLRAELGWNIYNTDCHHLGVYFSAAAPTGNTKQACLLFQPLVGNGHHWEWGGGLNAHRRLYECDDFHISFFLDGYVTHLFGTNQQRTFDLCNKPNSRYMLAMRLDQPIVANLSGDDESASLSPTNPIGANSQFKGEYTPVANLTTVNVKVNYAAEAEVTALFNFSGCAWSFDVGYNFWGRSCTKFECPTQCDQFGCGPNICNASEQGKWVLKGDARVYGFSNGADTSGLPSGFPVALSPSQSHATIRTGTNATSGTANASNINGGINNPFFAYAGVTNSLARLLHSPNAANSEANHINTSIQPIFISCQDLNLQSIRGISHKVFAHLSYNWDCECVMPFLGIGGFGEFGKSENCCSNDCSTQAVTNTVGITTAACNTNSCGINCCPNNNEDNRCSRGCFDCALSQWGVWIKGGVSW